MKYVKQSKNYITIPDNYEQTFVNSNFAVINENSVVLQKYNGNIDNEDMTLIKFIHDMVIVTAEQIERFCKIKDITEGLKRTENLITSAVLNKFFLTDEVKYTGVLPDDIRMFYCLQDGGRILLEKYREMDLVDWTQAKNCMSSRGIHKTLINTELYLEMLSIKEKFFSFEKTPYFPMSSSTTLRAGASFGLKTENGNVYLLSDCIKKNEDIASLKERFRRYETLIKTRRWKRFYHESFKRPVVCFIVDSDVFALAVGREISETAPNLLNYICFTTPERLLRGIQNENSALEYDANSDALLECGILEILLRPEAETDEE